MKVLPGIMLVIGLALTGWAGFQMVSLPGSGADDTVAKGSDLTVETDWTYDAAQGFVGEVRFDRANTETPAPAVLPISYPSAFFSALSMHRLDQKLSPQEMYDARQVNGLAYLGCLEMESGLALSAGNDKRTTFVDYRVCPVTIQGDNGPVQAVIGYLHPAGNHQPIGDPVARCAGEAAVWLRHVGASDTRIAICMIVLEEAKNQADLVVFERIEERLVVHSARSAEAGQVFAMGKARRSDNLARFTYFQNWKQDQDSVKPTFYAELPDIGARIKARVAQKDLRPYFEVTDVAVYDEFIRVHLKSLSDARVKARDGGRGNVRSALFSLLCNDPKTAAFLDLQQLDTVLGVRLTREDGAKWMDGRHQETPCNSTRE